MLENQALKRFHGIKNNKYGGKRKALIKERTPQITKAIYGRIVNPNCPKYAPISKP
jgi:hypothetical protein